MLRYIVVLLLLILLAPLAFADHTRDHWADVGGWSVYVEDEGCSMLRVYEDDITLHAILEDEVRGLFLVLLDVPWDPAIEDGDEYEVLIALDDNDPWKATASGFVRHGVSGLVLQSDKGGFLTELIGSEQIRVAKGEQVWTAPLGDPFAAMIELANCVTTTENESGPF